MVGLTDSPLISTVMDGHAATKEAEVKVMSKKVNPTAGARGTTEKLGSTGLPKGKLRRRSVVTELGAQDPGIC